ncbi:hypothetical protein JCM6882_003135 [Rhodosporidiobolus microsporus]
MSTAPENRDPSKVRPPPPCSSRIESAHLPSAAPPDLPSPRSHHSQTMGNLNSAVGTAKAAVGDATGLSSLSQAGNEQRAAGNAEYKAAQVEGYAEGTADRLGGKFDRVVGAVTGDKEREASGVAQEEKGKAQQSLNQP